MRSSSNTAGFLASDGLSVFTHRRAIKMLLRKGEPQPKNNTGLPDYPETDIISTWKWMIGKRGSFMGRPIFSGYLSFREGNNPTFPHTNCEQKRNSKKTCLKRLVWPPCPKNISTQVSCGGVSLTPQLDFIWPQSFGWLFGAWDVNVCDLASNQDCSHHQEYAIIGGVVGIPYLAIYFPLVLVFEKHVKISRI